MDTPFQLAADPSQSIDTIAAEWAPAKPGDPILNGVERNRRNAAMAARGIKEATDTNEDEIQFSDMFGNMFHLADLLGVDIEEAFERGRRYYMDEVTSEV